MNTSFDRFGITIKPQNDLEELLLEKLNDHGQIEPILGGMGNVIGIRVVIPVGKLHEAKS